MAGISAPNYDYDQEQADLVRKQRIADAMLSGGLSPMETNLGPGVNASPFQGLAKILQAYLGSKKSDAIAEERRGLTNRYQADGRAGLEKLIEGMSATPGMQTAQGLPDGGQGANNPSAYVAPTMQSPQDAMMAKRKAILEAMGSNHPMLQQLGASQLAGLTKDQLTPKDVLPYAEPSSIPNMASSGMAGFAPKKDIGEVGGVVYDKNSMKILQLAQPGGQPPAQIKIDGDLYEVNPSTMQLKKLDNAPKININNMPPPEQTAAKEFSKELAGSRAKMITSSYEKVKELPQTMATLDEASNALKAGIHSGQLGDVALTMSKLGEQMGFGRTDPAIANTEEFRAKMANSVLGILKTLRPASDKDVEYAKQAGGADIKLSTDAMQRLIDSARAAGYTSYVQHERLLQSNKDAAGALPKDLETFQVPFSFSADPKTFTEKNGVFNVNPPAATTSAPVSLDDYLKRLKK